MPITATVNANSIDATAVWHITGTLDSVGVSDDDVKICSGTVRSFRAISSLTGRPNAFSAQLNTDANGANNGWVRIHASDEAETTVDFVAEVIM